MTRTRVIGSGGIVLRADGVTVTRGRRGGGEPVLRDVSLEVRAGETVAVLGPNGAGKSTLLGAVAGTIPATGRIERAGRVAHALQSGALADRTAVGNVEAALAWWGVPRQERRHRALESLEQLSAGPLAGRRVRSLSGGERRRVHLARALALRADLLLLDEPFSALDPATRDALLRDLGARLHAGDAASVVVVHDRAEAWALADRIAVVLDGRVAAVDTPDRLLSAPPSVAVAAFLGYAGRLDEAGSVVMTRPGDARLDPDGPLAGRVAAVVRTESGARVEVELPNGLLEVAAAATDRPAVGDDVRLRLVGGVRFDPVTGGRLPSSRG